MDTLKIPLGEAKNAPLLSMNWILEAVKFG